MVLPVVPQTHQPAFKIEQNELGIDNNRNNGSFNMCIFHNRGNMGKTKEKIAKSLWNNIEDVKQIQLGAFRKRNWLLYFDAIEKENELLKQNN